MIMATPQDFNDRFPISDIKPSPENDTLYRPVLRDDPATIQLTQSVEKFGLKEPIVLTRDGYILSGHRRYAACRLAGLTHVPVRFESVSRTDPEFLQLLREYNRQREKSLDERLREEVVSLSAEDAYGSLLSQRAEKVDADFDEVQLRPENPRSAVSEAKRLMVARILQVVTSLKPYWPLSDRQIHYQLLNDPPLRHAKKPASVYRNDQRSYSDLVDLLTRLRLTGRIPMRAIADSTRPVTTWDVWQTAGAFIHDQVEKFGKGYFRDLQISQPIHWELVVEKNTVESLIRPVAADYCLPLTSGRGYCSLPPRAAIVERFENSGKDRLGIIVVSDFDPDGESICESLGRSVRDDFGVEDVLSIKAALTFEQTQQLKLPPGLKAKESSSRYANFAKKYGNTVYELEALPPEMLQQIVDECIRSVIDIELYNQEVELEKRDAAWLNQTIQRLRLAMREIDLDE